MRRWIAKHPLVAVLLVALLAMGTGLGIARFVVSPEQAAVDAAPPEPTVMTSPVTRGTVSETLPVDARIEQSAAMNVVPAAPADGSLAVVTGVHVRTGEPVESGQALADVGGRPTFVLLGSMAAYRAMGPGMSGPDVSQLQETLRSLGYEIDEGEGTFGSTTKTAVTGFYSDRGYEPVHTGEEESEAAREAMVAAERAEAEAETALYRAERDRTAARRAAARPPQEGEEQQEDPGAGAGADDAVEDARLALEYARDDRSKAAQELEETRAAAGPQIPLGEVAFVAELPATPTAVPLQVGAQAEDAAITLSSGELVAKATFPQTLASDLRGGLPAQIITTEGQQIDAEIVSAVSGGKDDSGLPTWAVSARPAEALDSALTGQTVRLMITLSEADQEALLVPEAAVQTRADGTSIVEVTEPGSDETRLVEVALEDSGDGRIAVVPLQGESLDEGDPVVIGRGP